MTVWIYVDTSRQVGDAEHRRCSPMRTRPDPGFWKTIQKAWRSNILLSEPRRRRFSLFTSEPTACRRHIRIPEMLNPTVRTVALRLCRDVADHATPTLKTILQPRRPEAGSPSCRTRSRSSMDALRKKIRHLEIASHMNRWLTSSGLQP